MGNKAGKEADEDEEGGIPMVNAPPNIEESGGTHRLHYDPPSPDRNEDDLFPNEPRVNPKVIPGMGRAVVVNAQVDPMVDTDPNGERDTVVWGAVEYLADENDGKIMIQILRWGPATTTLELWYDLRNVNLHPDSFKEHKGWVTMRPGEMAKKVPIPIQDDPYWNVEGIMVVDLVVHKGKADVGDLGTTTIVILNDDKFPMNVKNYMDKFAMVKGFIVHNYHLLHKEVWWCVGYKMVPALTWCFSAVLMKSTLDMMSSCVHSQDVDDDDERKSYSFYEFFDWINNSDADSCMEGSIKIVWLFAVLYILNHGIAFTVDCSIGDLKLGGKATRALRTGIFSVMLQFTKESDEKFPTGKVMKIMESQTESAVKLTWLNCFTLVEKVFSLIVVSCYIIAMGIEEGGNMIFVCICPFIVIAGQAAVFVHSKGFIVEMNTETMEKDDKWSEFLAERAVIRPMITNYAMGNNQAQKFEKIHAAYNAQWADTDGWWGVTLWRVATAAEIVAFLFLGAGATAVIRGNMKVGTFVTSLGAISTFGGLTGSIFQAIFDLMKGYASVLKISQVFNASTRRFKLKEIDENRKHLVQEFNNKQGADDHHAYLDTKEQIMLHNVVFTHHRIKREGHEGTDNDKDDDAVSSHYSMENTIEGRSVSPSDGAGPPIERFHLPRISAVIEAGSVIALTGPGGTGKTTLMRILAQHFHPSKGWVSYPAYWRVRLLDAMDPPYFFKGTMKENLSYGNIHKHTDREMTELLEELGVSSKIADNLADMQVDALGSNLSLTDATLCAIARCLLSSVDLLLISNLLDVLSENFAEKVMGVFKDFTSTRKMSYLRSENAMVGGFHKPKTVIVGTKKTKIEEAAHTRINMADMSKFEAPTRQRVSVALQRKSPSVHGGPHGPSTPTNL